MSCPTPATVPHPVNTIGAATEIPRRAIKTVLVIVPPFLSRPGSERPGRRLHAHLRPLAMRRPPDTDVSSCRALGGCLTAQGLSLQYSLIATSKYQVRRISITSHSRASPGGNAG